jgi:carbonic anhydrase
MRIATILFSLSILMFSNMVSANSYTLGGSDWTGTCATGQRQTPINIVKDLVTDNTDVSITASLNDIVTGSITHSTSELKVTYTNGTLTYRSDQENTTWNVAQFHFHAPSEHTINNVSYALEMHTVFTLSTNSSILLVVGVLYETDTGAADDAFITSLNLTSISGATRTISNVDMSGLSDWVNSKKKYNYKGGLTTPTCDEAVEWMLVTEPRKINAAQLALFTSLWAGNAAFAGGRGNNRLIQATNRREVQLIGADGSDWGWVWPVVGVLIVLALLSIGAVIVVLVVYQIKMTRQNKRTSKHDFQDNGPQLDASAHLNQMPGASRN